jgi:hypothetical protein
MNYGMVPVWILGRCEPSTAHRAVQAKLRDEPVFLLAVLLLEQVSAAALPAGGSMSRWPASPACSPAASTLATAVNGIIAWLVARRCDR